MLAQEKSEKGQALIFIVIGFVILLGFVGLAIDGGRVYSDRRHAQNSSDAASLAGGAAAALSLENSHLYYSSFDCGKDDGNYIAAAMQAAREAAASRATSNGFSISLTPANFNYVKVICVSTCPVCGGFATKYLDVTVNISTTTPTTFASFLFKPGLPSQVSAVTRVYPRMPLAFGHAVVALNPSNCQGQQNGIVIHGTADTIIKGGGIFSNGCLQNVGNATAEVQDSTIYYNYAGKGLGGFDPQPLPATFAMPANSYTVPKPDCAGYWFTDFPPKGYTDADGYAKPGLYCFQNAPKFGKSVLGKEVTIYIENGGFDLNGNTEIHLTAPKQSPDPKPAIPGILFYLPPANTSSITINGNETSDIQGVILAPGASVSMLGTGQNYPWLTQVIAYNVELGGTAQTKITYQSNRLHNKPTSLNLQK
jgi:hypothetical protein